MTMTWKLTVANLDILHIFALYKTVFYKFRKIYETLNYNGNV